MKTIILCNSSAGLYKFRKELVYALREGGHAVAIVAPDGDYRGQFEDKGCSFAVLPMERRGTNVFKDLKLIRRYKAILKAEKPDIVLTYTIKPNIYGGIAAKKLGIPFVANITGAGTAFEKGGLLKKLVVHLYKKAFKKAGKVIFQNRDNRETFVKEGIIDRDRTILVNGSGVNLDEFVPAPLPVDREYLFIGRVMREKGIDEFFKAARAIKAREPAVRFGVLGAYEESYQQKIDALSEQGVVAYYGFQKDVKPYVKNACCVVQPSYHEGMSNVLLEAAAMGRPLLASDIPGCREIIRDGVNGYLFRAKDAADLTDKLLRMQDRTYEELSRMGEQSVCRVREDFDRKLIVEKIIETIKGVVGNGTI